MPRPRFSLRTLLVVVTILASGFATRPYVIESQGPRAGIMSGHPWGPIYFVERRINPRLVWPATALGGFAAWKIVRRLINPPTTP